MMNATLSKLAVALISVALLAVAVKFPTLFVAYIVIGAFLFFARYIDVDADETQVRRELQRIPVRLRSAVLGDLTSSEPSVHVSGESDDREGR
ncbi:hypothetical protein B2J88_27140 [Rhodococcus sp. SRB_17]|nr:hypothetical protein [Rhodococcus sp. SRB_17]